MKKIKAFVRWHKVESVLETLFDSGIGDVTLIDVLGRGSYSDPATVKYSYRRLGKYSEMAIKIRTGAAVEDGLQKFIQGDIKW